MQLHPEISWRLIRQTIPAGAHTVLIDVVADQDALMNDLLAKGNEHPEMADERVPYWGELWPSAIGLSAYLAQASWMKEVRTVHELGCGLAFPGIVTGFYDCDVILSDYLEGALQLAEHNWHLNHQKPMRTALVDWRDPDLSLTADLILASDVAYEARAFAPLVKTFHSLCNQGGRILLAEPGRDRAKPFLERLPEEGFSVKNSSIPVIHNRLSFTVNVLELQKK
jgi:predicted nicotinamide N-methyase